MNLWPIQKNGVRLVLEAFTEGLQRVVLTAPTGTGKTRMEMAIADHFLDQGKSVVLYTLRRSLFRQLSRELDKAGLEHGRRAAGYKPGFGQLQLASMPTEARLSEVPPADLVIVDEGHLFTGPTYRKVLDAHAENGAKIVLVTATPLGMAGVAEKLLIAGTMEDGRSCGALVRAIHYGPTEPDLKAHKSLQPGNLPTEPENRKIMRPEILFGSVWEWFNRLNPERKPTILFASGVEESVWFAQEFTRLGVSAAHIDGSAVWADGKFHRSNVKLRDDVLKGSKDGRISVLCNRFVLREGIDAPWLAHGVFATVFGSLQSYLQSGGRLLRTYPGMDSVTIQDHGGNWWRHGSLNADRAWRLEYTADVMDGIRQDRQRKGDEPQPGRCPQCSAIIFAPRCKCGWSSAVWRKARPVMMSDGTLREVTGDAFKPRQVCQRPDGKALWERMYYRSRTEKGARTFRAAMALFAHERYEEQGYATWPDPKWPLMPREELDFYRLVAEVPAEDLIPKGATSGPQ